MVLVHRHGAQGIMDRASKATLANEFGTSNEDECLIKILEKGDLQGSDVSDGTNIKTSNILMNCSTGC